MKFSGIDKVFVEIIMCTTICLGGVSAYAEQNGGTLTVAVETDARGFDAVKGGVLGSSAGSVSLAIHDTLLRYNNSTKKYEPNLATSWSSSENQLLWTFKLRKNVKFHNGDNFVAKDVANHINRILDPKNRSRSRSFITAIKGVKVLDPHTVQFELKHPWIPLLGNLAVPSMIGLIPSHKSVEAGTQNRAPVGTGPFTFSKWAGGDRITLNRNKNYWNKDATHLDRIVFRILPDTQSRFASLKSGEVDVIWTDRGSSVVKALKDPKISAVIRDGKGAKITFFNTSKPPMDDVRVRQALAHAWDQNAILKVTWKNTVPFAKHPLGADSKCDAKYLAYNPQKAKDLVAAYGKPINVEMIHTTTDRGREFGEIYQQLVKKVGINLKLIPVDQNTLVKKVFTNDYMISGWRIADAGDVGPQTFALSFSKSPYNLTRYKNPTLDKVAMGMRVAKTEVGREKMHCKLMQMINQSGHMGYRGGNRYYVFHNKTTHDISIDALGVADVRQAWKSK